MKKKLIALFIVSIVTFCFSGIFLGNTASAQDTVTTSQIGISSYPSKTTYRIGESFDSSGMKILSLNSDGSSHIITDYTIEGFDSNIVGSQMITIRYQKCTAYISITVLPEKVGNITVSDHTKTSYTLMWDAHVDITNYEIYRLDSATGVYSLYSTTDKNTYTFYDSFGSIRSYQIRALMSVNGVNYVGEFSDPYSAATDPGKVDNLTVMSTTQNSVELSWSTVHGVTGYSIYRIATNEKEYVAVGDTTSTTFIDTSVKSGTAYQYKVCAYILKAPFSGEFSPLVDTSTKAAKVILKSKAGDQKVRLTWAQVTGVNSYDIYAGNDMTGFNLLTTLVGDSVNTYTLEGLTTGETYSFYAIAHREYQGVSYDSVPSDIKKVTIGEIEATSTEGKIFADELEFMNSDAYNMIPYFKENVDYTKSYVVPGMITTNVDGFNSKTMCPQGITFAEDYLLITAYDLTAEEASVLYVMDKNTKELLTTLVLPTYTHVGGICYDGKSVWLTTGSKVSAIWFSDIEEAVEEGEAYSNITFHSICKVGLSASYITYFKDKLWVGTYNELKATKVYTFQMDDYDSYVTLTKVDMMTMPTRVQGISFTEDEHLIISRSCQLYEGLRGYMRRIDVYQPEFSEEGSGNMDLGECINYISIPSMNEGIALEGDTIYVLFESVAFEKASYTMDRICAFSISSILEPQE